MACFLKRAAHGCWGWLENVEPGLPDSEWQGLLKGGKSEHCGWTCTRELGLGPWEKRKATEGQLRGKAAALDATRPEPDTAMEVLMLNPPRGNSKVASLGVGQAHKASQPPHVLPPY